MENEMKDPADKHTPDLFPKPPAPNAQYEFSMLATNGTRLVWTHLTRKQAEDMHKLAERVNPLRSTTEVARFSWTEMA
jgi:hypothetical protein